MAERGRRWKGLETWQLRTRTVSREWEYQLVNSEKVTAYDRLVSVWKMIPPPQRHLVRMELSGGAESNV